jgi:hypothetical protein
MTGSPIDGASFSAVMARLARESPRQNDRALGPGSLEKIERRNSWSVLLVLDGWVRKNGVWRIVLLRRWLFVRVIVSD